MTADSKPTLSNPTTTRLRLALSVEEAADALGVSRDSFERHVMAELSLLRVGRRLLVPAKELERWIDREMATPLLAELSAGRVARTHLRGIRAR